MKTTTNRGRVSRWIGKASAVVAASLFLLSAIDAQEKRERDRPHEPSGEPHAPREPGNREGTPEGIPHSRIAPPEGGARSRLLPRRWLLGVHAYNTETGVVITHVLPRSPAAEVGLEPNDRIVTVDGFQVGYVNGRLYAVGDELQHRAGPQGRVTLLVQNVRDQRLMNLDVTLRRDSDFPPRPRER